MRFDNLTQPSHRLGPDVNKPLIFTLSAIVKAGFEIIFFRKEVIQTLHVLRRETMGTERKTIIFKRAIIHNPHRKSKRS